MLVVMGLFVLVSLHLPVVPDNFPYTGTIVSFTSVVLVMIPLVLLLISLFKHVIMLEFFFYRFCLTHSNEPPRVISSAMS